MTMATLEIPQTSLRLWEQPPWSCFPGPRFALQLGHPLLNVLRCINIPTIKPLKSPGELITLEVTFKTCQ